MLEPDLAARVLRAARTCSEAGITQQQIAAAVGASQSQVSRVLSGRGQRLSRLTLEVCEYVERGTSEISREAVCQNDELVDAIRKTWDGSAGHARALATIIRSLSALTPPKAGPL